MVSPSSPAILRAMPICWVVVMLVFSFHLTGWQRGALHRCSGLLAEPGLARRLGQAGQEAIIPYTLPQVLPQIMELYHQVVPLDEPEKVYSLEQIS